jgi:hypothetical protein
MSLTPSPTLEEQHFARGFPMTAFPLAGSSSSFCRRLSNPTFTSTVSFPHIYISIKNVF